ncbi:MAG: T9SS type A sorting domain-containing protein [Phaeodactylibacter sp.]|nr:T9SS type A sorting domain-containing protein [Phaeodactylibacter sp.]
MGRALCLALFFALLSFSAAEAQDFIMQGCYWSCPEDDPNMEVDTAALQFWVERMEKQATELSYSGFSYLWLPSLKMNSPEAVKRLMLSLQKKGIQPIANLEVGDDSLSFGQQADQLHQRFDVNAYSLHRKQELNPQATAREINEMFVKGTLPQFVVAALPFSSDPARLGKWAAEVIYHLNPAARPEIDPRVYDYPLREALRQACTDSAFDVRLVFERSIRDASAISGFNIVTMANHPVFKNQNNKKGDWDDPIANPLLAYAYILTNNQLGLPTIYYGDYYGDQSELPEYAGKQPLKEQIDQLIKAHKDYIYGSTAVEYLNRFNTDKASFYLSAPDGVDSTRALIFQMDGTNTPAGEASNGAGKDVLVAINFGNDTLQAIQEINRSNLRPGDHFTDVLGSSLSPRLTVFNDTAHSISNAVLLRLPPRSFGAWVQGRAEKVSASRITLAASSFTDYIELNWDVAYEAAAIGYEVERSVNGKGFKRLASIAPMGQGEESASYLYIDKDIFLNEQLEYRIKMLDNEGGYEYSPPVKTRLKDKELSFELHEGPGEWMKTIRVKSNYSARAEVELFDAKGTRVFQRTESIQKGSNLSELDLSRLPNGVYYLSFSVGAGKAWSRRLVKQ